MIAENYNQYYKPNIAVHKGTLVSIILNCLRSTAPHFKNVILQPDIIKPLNENKLTQLFVEQFMAQLNKLGVSLAVGMQYSDIFFNTKGIPDFYLYVMEEGRSSIPIFIVEAKRLPAPAKKNEKEYVKGIKVNGGIERFKIGKHGKGLLECGMIGFIEEQDTAYWLKSINTWITDLSASDKTWKIDEILDIKDNGKDFSYLISKVHREKADKLNLHHFWII